MKVYRLIILLMRTTKVNVVRGGSYENVYTRKFIIQNFVNMKISRSTYGMQNWHGYAVQISPPDLHVLPSFST